MLRNSAEWCATMNLQRNDWPPEEIIGTADDETVMSDVTTLVEFQIFN